ncbi:21928_t:CDS:2, partial [Gigaspora margarita]
PRHPIWSFFKEGEEIDSGHRSVSCKCGTSWRRGKPSALERHILVECKKTEPHIKEAVRKMIEAREKELTQTNRKRKATEDQQEINNYFESLALNNEQKTNFDTGLIKLFVCGGLSWRLVEHPFFIEFVQQLRPAYSPPLRKALASTLLDNEFLRVHTKIYHMLEKEKNLTLDGLTSPDGKALWNFIIHTSNGNDILWKILDFSDRSHTGQYLAEQIETILNDIGNYKFSAIVTDAGPNVRVARQIIVQKFPHIFNIRCIGHCLNLVTKDMLKHTFATRIINWSTIITSYFNKSHLPKNLLESKIKKKEVAGGGLKTYVNTRWTTAYEMLYSIYQLESCLKEVITENPNIITNEMVQTIILRKRGFFQDVSGQILIAQLRDYHVRKPPYNASYTVNVDPQTWWETCESNFPYLRLLAIKLFSVSPHAASCERVWSICGWVYGQRRTNLSIENLDAIAQIRSYYIANNKFELPRYSIDKSAEDIRKILYDADLYEESDAITFEQAIMNANINQSNIDDDNDIVSEEFFELEEALDLSNPSFLTETSRQTITDIDDDVLEAGPSDWLEEFNQEEDYDPAELGEMFLNYN